MSNIAYFDCFSGCSGDMILGALLDAGLDMDTLKSELGADHIQLADEEGLARLFGDCALGAEPPFGDLYGLETLMDETLEDDPYIVFQAGTHELAIQMDLDDYKKLAKPRVFRFSYHMQ